MSNANNVGRDVASAQETLSADHDIDPGTLMRNLRGLAARMHYRVEVIEARDGKGAAAIKGPGVGIGYLLAKDLAEGLSEAANYLDRLPPAQTPTREALEKIEGIIADHERCLALPDVKAIKQIWNIARAALQVSSSEANTKPVAYACFTDNGNIRLWSTNHAEIEAWAKTVGRTVTPLYAASPSPAGSDPHHVRTIFGPEYLKNTTIAVAQSDGSVRWERFRQEKPLLADNEAPDLTAAGDRKVIEDVAFIEGSANAALKLREKDLGEDALAQAIFEARHHGLKNCLDWEDSDIDRSGDRAYYLSIAKNLLAKYEVRKRGTTEFPSTEGDRG